MVFEGSVFVHDDRQEGYDCVEVKVCGADAEVSGNTVRFVVPNQPSFEVECRIRSGEETIVSRYLFLTGNMGSVSQKAVLDFVKRYREENGR